MKSAARRVVLKLLPAAGLLALRPAVAGLLDPDVREVEIGSSSSGVLDVKTSRRLKVRSQLRTRTIRWVDQNGRTVDTSVQTLVDNKYDWQNSVERSTDIWQITAEDLKRPELMVLRVRSAAAPLLVTLFIGVDSPGRLDPDKGAEVPPSEDSAIESLALFRFDPALRHFVTVQAEESERVPYRIAVLPAGRFRR